MKRRTISIHFTRNSKIQPNSTPCLSKGKTYEFHSKKSFQQNYAFKTNEKSRMVPKKYFKCIMIYITSHHHLN